MTWTLPSLNLDTCIVANCRKANSVDPNEKARCIGLFANVTILVSSDERAKQYLLKKSNNVHPMSC